MLGCVALGALQIWRDEHLRQATHSIESLPLSKGGIKPILSSLNKYCRYSKAQHHCNRRRASGERGVAPRMWSLELIRSLRCTLISRHLTRSCCEIVVGPVWACRVKTGVVISSLDGSAAEMQRLLSIYGVLPHQILPQNQVLELYSDR
jgi:hypothetical protein